EGAAPDRALLLLDALVVVGFSAGDRGHDQIDVDRGGQARTDDAVLDPARLLVISAGVIRYNPPPQRPAGAIARQRDACGSRVAVAFRGSFVSRHRAAD